MGRSPGSPLAPLLPSTQTVGMTGAWSQTANTSSPTSPPTTTSTSTVSSRWSEGPLTQCPDCSKFWQCTPSGACLQSCPPCPPGACPQNNALSFDCRYQAPLGPVCDWPDSIDCSNSPPCDSDCCSDQDCQVSSSHTCQPAHISIEGD